LSCCLGAATPLEAVGSGGGGCPGWARRHVLRRRDRAGCRVRARSHDVAARAVRCGREFRGALSPSQDFTYRTGGTNRRPPVRERRGALSPSQDFTYRTGGANRQPPVTVYRSVSRSNRCLPSKFKFSNQTASQSVTDRFTGR
jgi:hypothetical protein